MKTLLITLEYPPFRGGVANYYGSMVKYWPENEEIEVRDNSEGDLFSGNTPFPWFKSISYIYNKRKENAFDYLLVGHILPLGTAAYLVSLLKPFKYAVFLHGLDFASARKTMRKKVISNLVLKRADKIICANSYVKELVIQSNTSLERKIVVQNPGVEVSTAEINNERIDELKNRFKVDSGINLVSIGRLVLRKGFDKVIEALSSLKDRNIKYFILGVGEEELYLKELVRKYQLEDKVYFLGPVTEEDKVCWLNIADIFIMPARQINEDFEGFGIVYLEANVYGKPVIAGNSGGVSDAVLNNETGLLINPEKLEDIKEAIITLSTDREMRLKLGQRGYTRAKNEFNWERLVRELFNKIKQ